MERPIIIKFASWLLNILVCLIAVAIDLYRQEWFGKGDIYSFVFWTIPLATGLTVSGTAMLSLLKSENIYVRVLFVLFISTLVAYGWIYFVYLILGPWINAFSFPVFYLWTTGNFFQLFLLDRFLKRIERKSRVVYGLLAFPLTLLLTVIAIYALSLLQAYFTHAAKETYLIPDTFEGRFRAPSGYKVKAPDVIKNPSALSRLRSPLMPERN